MRICSTDRAGAGFRLLDSLGLFAHVLPEMEVTRGVEQPKEHYYDVLGHSFAAVDALDWLMAEKRPADVARSANCGRSCGRSLSGAAACASTSATKSCRDRRAAPC